MTEKNKSEFAFFVRAMIHGAVDDAILFNKGKIQYSELCRRLHLCEELIIKDVSKKAKTSNKCSFLDKLAHKLKRLLRI
jgi:hypothetical protein|nr:MAG TPA: hypothetical protein [Caudoviricetes sp.]